MAETISKEVRIDYDDLGRGEPALLFMPGWCESRTVFAPVASRCALHRRALALDWRGHGKSETPSGDFGTDDLVEDARAVIEASGARRVVPVAISHAGWIAIELRRRLGERITKLVLLDWIVLAPPQPFLEALDALQEPEHWERTREELFSLWIADSDDREVIKHVHREMGLHDLEMWARAAREIAGAYSREGNPLQALRALKPPATTLHLCAQPQGPEVLAAQRSFAGAHPWFSVRKLEAVTHFPALERPDEVASAIEQFIG